MYKSELKENGYDISTTIPSPQPSVPYRSRTPVSSPGITNNFIATLPLGYKQTAAWLSVIVCPDSTRVYYPRFYDYPEDFLPIEYDLNLPNRCSSGFGKALNI